MSWSGLELPASATSWNVAHHLARQAKGNPDRFAIHEPIPSWFGGAAKYQSLTFQQLYEQSDQIASGLLQFGFMPGMRTALMIPPSIDFFLFTFAMFKAGLVPVLIDPGMGIRNLGKCLEQAKPEGFIGIPKAHLARKLLGWGRSTIKLTVNVARNRGLAQASKSQLLLNNTNNNFREPTADELAAILFTSGSTGVAKGVEYPHAVFTYQVEYLKQLYQFANDEVDLCTFPLFALFAPALGMTSVIPIMNPTKPAKANPKKLLKAIDKFGVTNLFGSPALIKRLGSYLQEQQIQLPGIRRIVSAGAPVSANVLEVMQKSLHDSASIFTPYGATESLPVSNIDGKTILNETCAWSMQGAGTCVGKPVQGMMVRIIPIDDEPIENWSSDLDLGQHQIGEIVVSGPVVTERYFDRPDLTKLAKIIEPVAARVWHRMGDLGYLDAQGRMWFLGRKSQRVFTTKGTLFTIPTEAVFLNHPRVNRAALVGIKRDSETYPAICIELKSRIDASTALVNELLAIAQKYAHTKMIHHVLFHPAFPVDIRHNAKIFREKLAQWAAHELKNVAFAPLIEPIELPPVMQVPESKS
jgi:olefin beta-lactone synthetase